ncbi:MAG: endolytic transglycosylase MltG [Muribaculaceae bacterium]|nr:endolytic transglycosylase MltG [Muribaculaceae bacterium]
MPKRRAKKKAKLLTNKIFVIGIAITIVVLFIGVMGYTMQRYDGDTQWIYIDKSYSNQQLQDSLKNKLGENFGGKVFTMWSLMGGDVLNSCGAYKVESGSSLWNVSHNISKGYQFPVKVTFNNVRTMEQLAQRVAKNMKFDEKDFLQACDTVLTREGFAPEEFSAAFFPDSYEFYWNSTPQSVVEKMLKYYRKYWDDEKVKKARSMGLTPVQVSTLASIVEEETNKIDERPKVARLYLNRLDKGMKLQADPTLKFAMNDFTIRRMLNEYLKTESPYNTYKYDGLPPGPIRIVDKKTLDAVLNAPMHDYIYMCAKEDFSGYHNFAADYDEHKANAKRYQDELDRRNIKK